MAKVSIYLSKMEVKTPHLLTGIRKSNSLTVSTKLGRCIDKIKTDGHLHLCTLDLACVVKIHQQQNLCVSIKVVYTAVIESPQNIKSRLACEAMLFPSVEILYNKIRRTIYDVTESFGLKPFMLSDSLIESYIKDYEACLCAKIDKETEAFDDTEDEDDALFDKGECVDDAWENDDEEEDEEFDDDEEDELSFEEKEDDFEYFDEYQREKLSYNWLLKELKRSRGNEELLQLFAQATRNPNLEWTKLPQYQHYYRFFANQLLKLPADFLEKADDSFINPFINLILGETDDVTIVKIDSELSDVHFTWKGQSYQLSNLMLEEIKMIAVDLALKSFMYSGKALYARCFNTAYEDLIDIKTITLSDYLIYFNCNTRYATSEWVELATKFYNRIKCCNGIA